jgi:hypothetical protein
MSSERLADPPLDLTGWVGPDEADRQWDALCGNFPEFVVAGSTGSSEGAKQLLWRFTRLVTGGEDLPNFAQEVGDCTGFGGKNAWNYAQCREIANDGDSEEFHPAHPSFLYGVGRVQVGGRRVQGDGAAGVWIALAAQKYGVLFLDQPGAPAYSGALSRRWGQEGPPAALLEQAAPQRITTTAKVTSYVQIREALAHGFPVTIATNYVPKLGSKIEKGRRWLVCEKHANEGHQWCLVGLEDEAAYGLNSWGPDAHGDPLNGEPTGGGWMRPELLDLIARTGECFAWSGCRGFPTMVPNVAG